MKKQIYEYLKAGTKTASVTTIAAAIGADNETVRRNVGKLVRDGSLARAASKSRYDARYYVVGALVLKPREKPPVIHVPARDGETSRSVRGSMTAHLVNLLHGACEIRRFTVL